MKSLLNNINFHHNIKIQGSFLNGVCIDELVLFNNDIKIEIHGLKLNFLWHDLLNKTLCLRNVSLQEINISCKEIHGQNYIKEYSKFQYNVFGYFLSQLYLKKLEINKLSIFSLGEKRIKFFINNIDSNIIINKNQCNINVNNLYFSNHFTSSNFRGGIIIHNMDNLPFELNFSANGKFQKILNYKKEHIEIIQNNIQKSKIEILGKINGNLKLAILDSYIKSKNFTCNCKSEFTILEKILFKNIDFNLYQANNFNCLSVFFSSNIFNKFSNISKKKLFGNIKISNFFFNINGKKSLISMSIDISTKLDNSNLLNIIDFSVNLNNATYIYDQSCNLFLKGYINFNKIYENIFLYNFNDIKNVYFKSYFILGKNNWNVIGNWNNNYGNLKLNNITKTYSSNINLNIVGDINYHICKINICSNDIKNPVNIKLIFSGSYYKNNINGHIKNIWSNEIFLIKANTPNFYIENKDSIKFNLMYGYKNINWYIGKFCLDLKDLDGNIISINHENTIGFNSTWKTSGKVNNFIFNPIYFNQKNNFRTKKLKQFYQDNEKQQLKCDIDWCLSFNDINNHNEGLNGHIYIYNKCMKIFSLDINSLKFNKSKISIKLNINSNLFGYIKSDICNISMHRNFTKLSFFLERNSYGYINANLHNLGLFNYIIDNSFKVNGHFKMNIILKNNIDLNGYINGQNLNIISIADGIKLLNGSLIANIKKDKIVIHKLKFPSILKIETPKKFIKKLSNELIIDHNSSLNLEGVWNFYKNIGKCTVIFNKFPLIQREDRCSIISGQLYINAIDSKKIFMNGDLTVNRGWVSLEILKGISKIDDDILFSKDNIIDFNRKLKSKINFFVDLNIDIGKNFYATGLGLSTGLFGNIHFMSKKDNQLIGVGDLNTSNGLIEIYGQKLHLTRGKLTFQGRLDNPLLDIEALRSGELIEAGIKVTGALQNPKIDIVSYPDVSDIQKLSWLIFGRGLDNSGSDAALLVSLGSAMIGSGEPLYKQLGLSDLSIKNGLIGTYSSLLPGYTVAGSINDNFGNLAHQFLTISKKFNNGISVSIEQSLSSEDIISKLSYSILKNISIDIKCGSVKGIAIIYSSFFNN
ncbi:translocation/assembly module TamB domain-containing protein [Candidatus Kinetoplastibacterium sorsogonicusi]|uniref:translocation/assembly module TamB domain-containing protein n=1 Tax=Candidatus Kinetoplastidibacterium kentomonadis TaxID=1576550 RepID=UPI0012370A24|nr:translocation/assembly module TamB domain-containing protein [Candidatus Kinetoplastibacterium sorsogonicusi]